MDILYLLIPLSVVLVFLIMGVFAWALKSGQLDDIDREGARILLDEPVKVDGDQARGSQADKEYRPQGRREVS